jgi:hypothetical protein
MSGVLNTLLAMRGELSVKTLTVGEDGVPESYGYLSGNYGSLSPTTTFNDNSGTSRTINQITYNTTTGLLSLQLTGNVANSDTTFTTFKVDSNSYTRASATYSFPGSYSNWEWSPGSNVIGTTGTKTITIT